PTISASCVFFFSSRRRHTRSLRDWSSDVCSSDLTGGIIAGAGVPGTRPRAGPADDAAGAPVIVPGTGVAALVVADAVAPLVVARSEERRVGKEGWAGWSPYD